MREVERHLRRVIHEKDVLTTRTIASFDPVVEFVLKMRAADDPNVPAIAMTAYRNRRRLTHPSRCWRELPSPASR
jgi:polyphosphate kinase